MGTQFRPAPAGPTSGLEATGDGIAFGVIVRAGSALGTAGSGILHLDAAGDHTDHGHIVAFFVLVAVVQLLWAAMVARREVDRRTFLAGLLFNAAVLAVWLISRSVGLPDLLPAVGGVEAVGWKDAAASGLGFAGLLAGGFALVMPPAAAAALIAPRSGERILRAMVVGTLAVTVPGALAAHGPGGHDHLESAALEVHDHNGDPDHDQAHADGGRPHVDAEVIAGHGHGAGGHGGEHTAGAGPMGAGHGHPDGDGSLTVTGRTSDPHRDRHEDDTTATAAAAAAAPAAALVGPGNVSTVRLGPFALLPSIPGMTAPHLSPVIPRVAPGETNLLPLVGVPPPCQDCYVLGLVPDLVYEDGTPANLDTGPMLHHAVWTDTSRPDPVCPPESLIGALGHRVFASGNERTGFAVPDGFGMPVGRGPWGGAVELMNTSSELRLVYVQLTARWLPQSAPGVRPVTSVWLDIDSCGDSEFDVPAGVSDVAWDWRSRLTGRIVAAGGHLHDGGEWLGLVNRSTGEHVCTSVAGYGGDPRSLGSLDSMTTCVWDRLATVRAGEVLRLNARYNTEAPATGVMGIMLIFLHETDDLASGTPSPHPAQPPPDGDPPNAGHRH